jgi:hypothetical protein
MFDMVVYVEEFRHWYNEVINRPGIGRGFLRRRGTRKDDISKRIQVV